MNREKELLQCLRDLDDYANALKIVAVPVEVGEHTHETAFRDILAQLKLWRNHFDLQFK